MTYKNIFNQAITNLKEENSYREFLELYRIAGQYPYAYNFKTNRKIVIWCSNDYLGMGQNSNVIHTLKQSADKYGVGAGGTRNISGNSHPLVQLESDIAALHKQEKALIFSSGYIANSTTIKTLVKILKDVVIFSDGGNHASIIDGINASGAKKEIFKHNNIQDLEERLKLYPSEQKKLIIFESVYSMNGNIAPIKDIAALAKKYHAMTYIDEVHSIGLYGKNGEGLTTSLGLEKKIDIIQGTFGKAIGLVGGYVSGNSEIIDVIRSYGSGFIFTTALPPAICEAIRTSIAYISRDDIPERNIFFHKVKKLKELLASSYIDFLDTPGHIIPVMIRDAEKCKQVADNLLTKHDIYIQAINYPTVEKGTERLRIIVTPFHSEFLMNKLVTALKEELG
ncbi:MAG: 5-aminolevulinate synthase [Rickettsiales bacterium]|jgi:5-aminolevulinate synthase|nr:5-aminolevulinate synthase [Rickettsiales bacterium]